MSPDQGNRTTEQPNNDQPTALKPWTAPKLRKQKNCAGKGVEFTTELGGYAGPS